MYLFLWILLGTALGYAFFAMGPIVGGILAFGIIAGCLFRGVHLLNTIHKRISTLLPQEDSVQKDAQAPIPDHLKSARAYKEHVKKGEM
ncbi:hypothetical protein [Falsibacillus albus]|uniref:Uncharacterized protein n=1 Tax=Falsibacillus albus TaxID=2478915 RepID=A0A3L7JUU5_9BACI|nr:hypothetical protein [Falsibacillus albus]RLQ94543.1 hypothetical protein D9X91_13450 [Falsibacillus albus]